jgi:hypothetical protein
MSKKDYSEFEDVCKVEHKKSVLKHIWDATRKDDRPHWEVMADDGMNKFLKFCITCVFLYFGYVTVIELWDKFT